jgi:hypothetical protein
MSKKSTFEFSHSYINTHFTPKIVYRKHRYLVVLELFKQDDGTGTPKSSLDGKNYKK